MKIKKTYQGELPENKIVNTESTSQTDTYSCEYINNLNKYLTDEVVVGTWLGKPLYRKVIESTFELPSVSVVTTKGVEHNIQNIGTIVNARMTDGTYNFPNQSTSGGITLLSYVNKTVIGIRYMNDSWISRTWYFILEYTKTTD